MQELSNTEYTNVQADADEDADTDDMEGETMIIFWILMGLLYLIVNLIITIAWIAEGAVADENKGMQLIFIIVLLFFGLPVMTIAFLVGMVCLLVKGEL